MCILVPPMIYGKAQKEHRAEGKEFERMSITSSPMTEGNDRKKEADDLAGYQRKHGKYPKYNKDRDG